MEKAFLQCAFSYVSLEYRIPQNFFHIDYMRMVSLLYEFSYVFWEFHIRQNFSHIDRKKYASLYICIFEHL